MSLNILVNAAPSYEYLGIIKKFETILNSVAIKRVKVTNFSLCDALSVF